jgi:hypothetical protein
VPDGTELGSRIANREALDNFSDEFWIIAEDVCVLFQHGWADPRLDQTGAREFVDQYRGVLSAGKIASFRMQVSRTPRKVGPGASQRPCASLRFDERNCLGLGDHLAPILAVNSRQRPGHLESDKPATNHGRRVPDVSVCGGSH